MVLTVSLVLTVFAYESEADDYSLAVAANTVDTVISEIIVKRAYEKLGHNVTINRLPPKRALEDANAGVYDGDVQRIHSVENSYINLIRLEPPINYINGTGFIHGSKDMNIKSWKDLEGHNVGIILGIKFAENNVNKDKRRVFYNYLELITALSEQRIDIGIFPESNGIYQALLTSQTEIEPLPSPLSRFELYHYIHRKNEHLTDDLEAVFQSYATDGTLEKIRTRALAIIYKNARKGIPVCTKDYACFNDIWQN